jgi:CRISPR system Cascade subunit CasA
VPESKFNLLAEPWLGVRHPDGSEAGRTLPEVLEALGEGHVAAFPALQTHQGHAWHAFLVQLAAIALHRAGLPAGPQDATTWARLLRALTEGRDEPWCLVVEDLSQPAFLQPPVPEGSLAGYKTVLRTPDAMDVLVTAKNHDVKAERIDEATPAHWAYTLVSLQTMQGFLGAGNYGIARMNGGFSSRPCFSYAPDTSWGPRFARDLAVVLRGRESIVSKRGYALEGGRALLWLEPWDGKDSLPLDACDPLFIEVCRRVRLERHQGLLQARTTSTKAARLQGKDLNGVTGDPWTPVHRTLNKALTVSPQGLTYALMQELFLGKDYENGVAGELTAQDTVCIASVLVRGQGKTEGWHERVIPIPPKARRILSVREEKDRLSAMAKGRVETAGRVWNQVLKPALCALLQAGPEKLDFKDARTDAWQQRHDRAVDTIFFEALWEDLELPAEEADHAWKKRLLALAEKQLDLATRSLPLPAARRYRAIAAGEGLFRGARRKHFPELFVREAEGAA